MEEKGERKNVFMGPEFVSKDMGGLWQWYENMFNASKLYTKKWLRCTEEIVQWLRTYSALAKDLSLVHRIAMGGSQLLVTPTGDPTL